MKSGSERWKPVGESFDERTIPLMKTIDRIEALGRLKVTGLDAGAFLQGQVTSDVLALNPGDLGTGAFCNPKGRVIANFLIVHDKEGFLLLLASDLVESICQHLQKYILRRQVFLEVPTTGTIGIAKAADLPAILSGQDLTLPRAQGVIDTPKGKVIVYAGGGQHVLIIDETDTLSFTQGCGDQQFFYGEIERGFPWIKASTRDLFLPQMLDLERFGGISYQKGCYTGQEIVARTHFLGQLKRVLYRGSFSASSEIHEGAPIHLGQGGTSESVGSLINQTRDSVGTTHCLVVLQKDQASSSDLRLNAADGPCLNLVPLERPLDS